MGSRLLDDGRAPAQHGADRRAETLREAEHHGVAAGDQLRRRHAEGDGRVPDAGTVTVHRKPAGAGGGDDRADLGRRQRPALRGHVCVLDPHERDAGKVVVAPHRGLLDLFGGDEAVGIGERMQLHAGVERRGGALVAVHVRSFRNQHFGARPREHPDRDLVRHHTRRHVERGFGAEQRGCERLQAVDRRVLAVRVVADLGGRHRGAHLVGRSGDRVAAEIDDAVHRHSPFALAGRTTGRINPSWITVIAS